MTYRVRFEREAAADLDRLWDFLAEHDLAGAAAAIDAIEQAMAVLVAFPFSFRKADHQDSPFLRELLIPFGAAGYVALYEIGPGEIVTILAVRHQREEDYH